MSKNQFFTDAMEYIAAISPNYKKSSVYDKDRKLRLISKNMYELYKMKRIHSSNPRKLKAADIAEYVTYRRSQGVKDSTICKDISLLRMFFKWMGNDAVEVYSAEYGTTKPVSYDCRKAPIDNNTIQKVYDLARTTTDWRTMEGCVAILLGTACGLRPQESRKLYAHDVHLMGNRSYIHVTHVKGEGKWGHERNVPVMDDVEDILDRFLKMRAAQVEKFGSKSPALFPPLRNDNEFLAQQTFSSAKAIVEDIVGDKFELRAGRRAFGQRALDSGQDLENVSAIMGHSSTMTTQRYYATKRMDDALNAMFAFKNSNRNGGYPRA